MLQGSTVTAGVPGRDNCIWSAGIIRAHRARLVKGSDTAAITPQLGEET
jgi:hypothetical protein